MSINTYASDNGDTGNAATSLQKEAFSLREAAEVSGIKKDLMYREINSGRLPSIKVGKRRLIRRESLNKWLAEREAETTRGMGFGAAA